MNLVLVEHIGGVATDVSLQALTLAAGLGGETHALLIGPGGAAAAANVPAAVVHVAEHDALDAFAPDAWAAILCATAERIGATAIVAPGSGHATDAIARAAVRLGEPLAANCISVTPGDPLLVTRVRWGGSLLEEARLHAGRALLTVAPHAVAAAQAGSPGAVESFTPELADADLIVRVWDRFDKPAAHDVVTDFNNIRITNDDMVFTVAFVPKGTEIPQPDWAAQLPTLGASDGGNVAPPTTIVGATTLVPPVPESTTIPGETTTPVAGGSTTTPAPTTTGG